MAEEKQMSAQKETRIQIIGCQIDDCTFQATNRCHKCHKMICPYHTRDAKLLFRWCWEAEQATMCPECGTSNCAMYVGLTILSVVITIIAIIVLGN